MRIGEGLTAGWAALNTPEQIEDLAWSDSPHAPSRLPRALGELAKRVEHNAYNNGRRRG